MTEQPQNAPQEPQGESFVPHPDFQVRAVREELLEERKLREQANDRATYLRAVSLQMQAEARQEISMRDAALESLQARLNELEAKVGLPSDVQDVDEVSEQDKAVVEDSLDDTVSWDGGSAPMTPTDGSVVKVEDGVMVRDGKTEPIPDFPEGLSPDAELVPSGGSRNGRKPKKD